jgi:hypothetical protein
MQPSHIFLRIMKIKFSRRAFIKIALASIGAFLASCIPRLRQTSPIITPIPTTTKEPEPALTETPTVTETKTNFIKLLTPENNASLKSIGKVTFSWESIPEADSYKFEIILPTNQSLIFETTNTYRDQYLDALSLGGMYLWKVTAIGNGNSILCESMIFSFFKPEYKNPTPTSTQTPTKENDSNSDTSATTDINQISDA